MGSVTGHTLANILREFDDVLQTQVGGLHLVETHPIAGSLDKIIADGGPVELLTRVDVVLTAARPLTIDVALIEQTSNAEELLRVVVDRHYRPFQEQLAKATHAAHLQWEALLRG